MNYRFKNKDVYYTLVGQGSPIVLLHGFLESSSIWNAIATPLSENFQILIVDLPGHGKTEVMGDSHSMELMAELVHSLVCDLGIETPCLLGHSMGGYVALAYAEKYPTKLSHLILLNSTAQADTPERIANRNRALEFMKKERMGFIASAIPQLFTEASCLQYKNEIKQLIKEAYSFPKQGIMANIRGMRDRKDRIAVLKQLDRPKMLICGENDPIVPIQHSKKLASTTKTPIEILAGSHMSWLENPLQIVKIVHFIENFGT